MSLRKVSFVEREYYHIYNRGNSKQKIFHDKKDYERFMELLYISNTSLNFKLFNLKRSLCFDMFRTEICDKLVTIGAYCLMPNHFHLLITQNKKDGISKFMQKLSTAYSMYYNKKYKRTGSLFEGKFKSSYIGKYKYLRYLFSYIHLNPIKLMQSDWKEKGIQDEKEALCFLNNYQYSSYLDFFNKERTRKQFIIINKNLFPKYFRTNEEFQNEIINCFKRYKKKNCAKLSFAQFF